MNQVVIVEHGGMLILILLQNELMLLLLRSLQILLPAELQDLPMGVRMLAQYKSRARCRPVLRHQPTGLVPDTAGVTQRFRPVRPRPPLRRLIGGAVEASPSIGVVISASGDAAAVLPPLHGGGSFRWRVRRRGGGRRRRHHEEARGPVPRGGAWALAAGLGGDRDLGLNRARTGRDFGVGLELARDSGPSFHSLY